MYIADVQTDPDQVYRECEQLRQELQKSKKDLQNAKLSADMIKDSDEKTKFYTGLPTYAVFLWLFKYAFLFHLNSIVH